MKELHKLDLTGDPKRPVIIMHRTADVISFSGQERRPCRAGGEASGQKKAEQLLAVYYISGRGHGGAEYEQLIGATGCPRAVVR